MNEVCQTPYIRKALLALRFDAASNSYIKVHIMYFFYSLIRIYTSSNDVPRINFLTRTQHNFFMIFQIL